MNLLSTDLIRKLKLKQELHPQPYKLGCLNNKNHMVFAHRCLLQIDSGIRMIDTMYCDVVDGTDRYRTWMSLAL